MVHVMPYIYITMIASSNYFDNNMTSLFIKFREITCNFRWARSLNSGHEDNQISHKCFPKIKQLY